MAKGTCATVYAPVAAVWHLHLPANIKAEPGLSVVNAVNLS